MPYTSYGTRSVPTTLEQLHIGKSFAARSLAAKSSLSIEKLDQVDGLLGYLRVDVIALLQGFLQMG